jgi:hypothetical protein
MNTNKISVALTLLLTVVPCALSQQANVSPSSLNFGAQVVTVVSVGVKPKP